MSIGGGIGGAVRHFNSKPVCYEALKNKSESDRTQQESEVLKAYANNVATAAKKRAAAAAAAAAEGDVDAVDADAGDVPPVAIQPAQFVQVKPRYAPGVQTGADGYALDATVAPLGFELVERDGATPAQKKAFEAFMSYVEPVYKRQKIDQ